MVSATAYSQTYILPTTLFDSLVYETYQGRQCKEVVKFQESEIQKGLAVEVKLNNELHIAEQKSVAQTEALGLAKAGENEYKTKYNIQGDITDHYKRQNTKLKVGLGFTILLIVGQIVFGGG